MSEERVMGEVKNGLCWCGRRIFERRELANRRSGDNFEFELKGHHYMVSVRYVDEHSIEPAEIFLNSAKIDSDHDLIARDAAVVISIALQYGVPLAALTPALGRDPDGKASSPIGKLLDILLGRDK